MSRLTSENGTLKFTEQNIVTLHCEKVGLGSSLFYDGKPIDKLAEYENTGLQPQEVEQLKQQQLAEKDELLKNAVVPKFKYNDRVFYNNLGRIENDFITNILIDRSGRLGYVLNNDNKTYYYDTQVFITREEAEAKLMESRRDRIRK